MLTDSKHTLLCTNQFLAYNNHPNNAVIIRPWYDIQYTHIYSNHQDIWQYHMFIHPRLSPSIIICSHMKDHFYIPNATMSWFNISQKDNDMHRRQKLHTKMTDRFSL